MKKNLILFALAFTISCQVFSQKKTDLIFYKTHVTYLLQGEGKWISPNADYDSTNEYSPSWFAYQYSKGIDSNTLRLLISAYLPQKAEWQVSRECNYHWDYKTGKPVSHSIGIKGDLGTGETEKITADEWIIHTTITQPGGNILKARGIHKLLNENLVTTGYSFDNGKWKENNHATWTQMKMPTSAISFMSTRDGNFEIYTMAVSGENLKNLSCDKSTDFAFSHLRNNDLLFYSNRTGNNDIFIASADGKKTTNLTNHPGSDRIPYVSPEGKRIIFVSDRDHREGEVYMMSIDGSDVKRITNNESFEDAPQWSPDGKKLVYTKEVNDSEDTSKKAPLNGEIFLMDTDGSNEQRISFRPGWDGGPTFSPDGKKIAFYGKTEKGQYDIFIMDADGKNLYNLTNDLMENYSPAWSPDGRWIAYTGGNSKNYDLWIIDMETKIKTRLTNHPKRDESPVWQY